MLRRKFGKAPPTTVFHCGNHQGNIIDIFTTSCCDPNLVTTYNVGAAFFGMGGNFIRLLHALASMVRSQWVPVVLDRPSDLAIRVSDEVQDFSVKNYNAYAEGFSNDCWSSDSDVEADADADNGRRSRIKPRHTQYIAAWNNFRSVFNACIWHVDNQGTSTHHLGGELGEGELPDQAALEALMKKGAHVTALLLFRTCLQKATQKKWTKFAIALLWHFNALGINGCLKALWGPAYRHVAVRIIKQTTSGLTAELEVNWHEMEGKRHKHYGSQIKDEKTMPSTITLGVTLEVGKEINSWFMTRSSFARRTKAQHKGRPAPLCDLVSPERSIFVRALQYLAFLLTGRAPKTTILIWSFKGYTSFEVWAANEPDDLIRCRRTVLCTSSLIDGRFWKILLSCPWIWAGIFDPRRSGDDRRLLCRKVHRLGTESKDSWFTDPVLEWIGSEDDFATEEFQMFGFLWTWSVSATICQWEFMYGRNRSRANRNQLWHNFSAHSYNQEKHRRFIWSKSLSMKASLAGRSGSGKMRTMTTIGRRRGVDVSASSISIERSCWQRRKKPVKKIKLRVFRLRRTSGRFGRHLIEPSIAPVLREASRESK